MKSNYVAHSPPNIPAMLDRDRSSVGERLAMWLLGVALLAICIVAPIVALA
jgi:hypothetical protein